MPHEPIESEEEIGQTGRGQLICRTQVRGPRNLHEKQTAVELAPGSVIRVSVGQRGKNGKRGGKVARLLAFVHPISGELVIRMGMYDTIKSSRGREDGPQVVWRSDAPVIQT